MTVDVLFDLSLWVWWGVKCKSEFKIHFNKLDRNILVQVDQWLLNASVEMCLLQKHGYSVEIIWHFIVFVQL